MLEGRKWQGKQEAGRSHQRVDKDSLGQHHIPLKLNFTSPQTLQPLQSHPCSFQGCLDMIFPNLLLCYSLCLALPWAELVVPNNPQVFPGLGRTTLTPKGSCTNLIYLKKKCFSLLPSCSTLCFSPSPPLLAGDTGLDILLGCFAYTFCSRMALSIIEKNLMVLPLFTTLELTKYFVALKESTGNSTHPDNVLFLFGHLMVCVLKFFLISIETLAQVLSSFINTTGYNLFLCLVFFFI